MTNKYLTKIAANLSSAADLEKVALNRFESHLESASMGNLVRGGDNDLIKAKGNLVRNKSLANATSLPDKNKKMHLKSYINANRSSAAKFGKPGVDPLVQASQTRPGRAEALLRSKGLTPVKQIPGRGVGRQKVEVKPSPVKSAPLLEHNPTVHSATPHPAPGKSGLGERILSSIRKSPVKSGLVGAGIAGATAAAAYGLNKAKED